MTDHKFSFRTGTVKIDWAKGEREMLRRVFGPSRQDLIRKAVRRISRRDQSGDWFIRVSVSGQPIDFWIGRSHDQENVSPTVLAAVRAEFSRITSGAA